VISAGVPVELVALEPVSPGLQFAVDPDREELFLGWQFEF
jgi:hypothetical protein